MAKLKERGVVQLVEMKNGPIAALLEQYYFSIFVLVELSQVVLHD